MQYLDQPADAPLLPPPRDEDYPGLIVLEVDATDCERGIFGVHERIPVVRSGALTLVFPKWLPGYHAPQSPIALLAGLEVFVNGSRIPWRRDDVEVHAFHVEIPAGAAELDVRFQFLSPTNPEQGRIAVSTAMLNLQWNALLLYPAGFYSRRIRVAPTVKLPRGWSYGSALRARRIAAEAITFDDVQLDVLVDSPLFAGKNYRFIELDEQRVSLHLVADRADQLAATEAHIAPHRALVAQADRLFGPRPFDRYDFLVALTDELGDLGCEHHRSTEIKTVPDYFTAWEQNAPARDVMSHEYTHAWNGKYRRGSDSWTPTFDRPIRNSLMWVYEGQTQYWGNILSTRSGLWTLQHGLESLARTAATYENRAGRRWRPMSDTTRDPIIASRRPLPWVSWQRSEDYYAEGQLMWLDVDTRIRELSGDTRSLDDFARRFFGTARSAPAATSPYDFDEVIATLEDVASYDWRAYLSHKLDNTEAGSLLDGITRGGYRLVYRDTRSAFGQDADRLFDVESLRFSLGLTVSGDGKVKEVMWESPAFHAKLTTGVQIIAVNGREFSAAALRRAVADAVEGEPVTLLFKRGKYHGHATIDYHGGLRHPHLEPIPGARRRLDEIYAAKPAR